MSDLHAELDHFDRLILKEVQRDAKPSLSDLARAVGLSTSPCWRRLKRLEEAGVIRGQVAILDPRALGLDAMAYVQVSLIDHREETIAAFDAFVAHEAQVIECASITGESDYMLKVVARDPEDLETFLMRRLLGLGIVRGTVTNFILRQKKYATALPVE
ncbi:Lrp/AsnC family transcriptional regulator [Marimonas lutisalis]|uniref:Lrp/AsnC family transcriptional regulator n=1 Tax=Marimonas lutisalis TaxID=2545756 RepID=UPI0010F7AFB2|nr:Lrp/AsnC family transcriptional regulator [Marimonas lutisalis]